MKAEDVTDTLEQALQASGVDQATWNIAKPADELAARKLGLHDDGPMLVETNQVKRILANVDADGGNGRC